MNKLKNISLIVLSIIVVLLSIKTCKNNEIKTIEVPVSIEVPVPVVEKEFDTVYLPQPIKTIKEVKIDSSIYEKYIKLKDSIKKDSLIKDVLTIREYNEVFDDSIQTINIYSNVTGTLNKQSVSYKTKKRSINIDTILKVDVKVPYKIKFAAGAELGIPIIGAKEIYNTPEASVVIDQDFVAKANFFIDTKKIIYSASIDTEKRGWVGLAYKF